MKKMSKKLGFTAVELLVTLFVAAAFLLAGYQLYLLIIKDGGESRMQARASNVAYDYLQRYKSTVTGPCTVQAPLNNQSITAANLSNVTVTVAITCPYGTSSSVSKILVSLGYNNPQVTVSEATYVTYSGVVTNGLVLNLDASNASSYSGAGTTWTDLSGNGDNGTLLNGVGYTNNNSGALTFDGINDYVDIGSPANLMSLQYPLTFIAWVNPNTLAQNSVIFHFKVTDTNSSYAFGIFSSGNLILVGKDTYQYGLSGISTYLTAGKWQHWAIVFTNPTDIAFYLNGVLQPLSNVANYWAVSGSDIRIGQRTSAESFNGLISGVRVYNRSLNTTEVQQDFNALRSRYGI